MVLLKIVLVGVAIVALMVVAQDQRWPQRAGVVGVCTATPAAAIGAGRLLVRLQARGSSTAIPNLEADRCVNDRRRASTRDLAVRRARSTHLPGA